MKEANLPVDGGFAEFLYRFTERPGETMLKKIVGSIQGKILLFFILSFVFIGIVTWQFQKRMVVVSVNDERKEQLYNRGVQLADMTLTAKENYENALIQLAYNRGLSVNLSLHYENYNDVWKGEEEICYLLKEQMMMFLGIENIHVYHDNETFCEDGRYLFRASEEELKAMRLGEWSLDEDGKYRIRSKVNNTYQGVHAVIEFCVDQKYVFGQLLSGMSQEGENCYIYDADWNCVVQAGDSLREDAAAALKQLPEQEVVEDQENRLFQIRVPVGKKWNVIAEYSMESTNDTRQAKAGRVMSTILILYCLATGALLILFLRGIFVRIKNIGGHLEDLNKREFQTLNQLKGYDEISRLENQYNHMIEKLNDTIDELVEAKTREKDLQIKVLESQINPHFLYNTLGMMRWSALDAGSDELVHMLDSMSTFYRLSLSRGRGLISVKKEVELIEAYLALQQFRYDNCVEAEILAEPETQEYLIPKMILQPLVENIYLHGNITLPESRKIKIHISKEEDRIRVMVWDNGCGMSEDVLDKLNHNIDISDERGVGISFIYSSLKTYFGDAGKIHFSSAPGKGTQVDIEMPLWEENNEGIIG